MRSRTNRSRDIQGAGGLRATPERYWAQRQPRQFPTFFYPFNFALPPLTGRCQPASAICFLLLTPSWPASTSFHTVVPAPIVAPLPTFTGATSCVLDPVCTSSSIKVLCLFAPS